MLDSIGRSWVHSLRFWRVALQAKTLDFTSSNEARNTTPHDLDEEVEEEEDHEDEIDDEEHKDKKK